MGGEVDRLGEVEEWGEEVTHLEEGRAPVVFNFRPKRFVRVGPDRVDQWQRIFKEELGIGVSFDEDGPYGPQPTISGSNDGWDDCDA
jgi:hypothetical protein